VPGFCRWQIRDQITNDPYMGVQPPRRGFSSLTEPPAERRPEAKPRPRLRYAAGVRAPQFPRNPRLRSTQFWLAYRTTALPGHPRRSGGALPRWSETFFIGKAIC
jgi:hypothetical protein